MEDVVLESLLSVVSRRLNFKSLEMFRQRGGMQDFTLCLAHSLTVCVHTSPGRNAGEDCLFPWEAYYPDIYHILINTNSALLVLLQFHIFYFFFSHKWRNTCDYPQHQVPMGINMHRLIPYCTKGMKAETESQLSWPSTGLWTSSYHGWKAHGNICAVSKRQRLVLKGALERPQKEMITSWACRGIMCGPRPWGSEEELAHRWGLVSRMESCGHSTWD
jgi:hypothetical protein